MSEEDVINPLELLGENEYLQQENINIKELNEKLCTRIGSLISDKAVLQQENKKQQKILNEFIEYTNKNPKVLQNPFFLDMRMKLSKGDK